MQQPYDPSGYRALTFHDAVPRFLSGEDTPRAYLERCLETIAQREPVVRAFVTLNPEGARAAADAAGERYRAGRPLSGIDGMPIGIKDLLMTADMPTKMGSPLFEQNFPKQDSACIQALRAAGAVVLGKTVTTELGMSHPGPTTNPFNAEHTPGGSSSGSAAAVGAAMVPATIGTQVVGSVIRPAGFCANYAIKPTYGALHRGERLSFSQSHLGVHAGSLADMWRVAIEIAKRSGGDPGHPGLFGAMDLHAPVKPTRLIVMKAQGWPQTDGATLKGFEAILDDLRGAGVDVVLPEENPLLAAFEDAIAESLEICRDVCAYELRWTLENLVAQFGGGLSDSMMSRLALSRAMTIDDYRLVLAKRETARRAFAAIAGLGEALISLSSTGPAPRKDNDGIDSGVSHTTGSPAFNAATSVLGSPAITMPLLAIRGLPVGVQVIGQPHTDDRLAGIANWITGHIRARSV
ncbi:amidase [Methylobacterium aquaticum]|uniref:Amidase n=1 Tax=Methylobacterium aquaticum TaxID=270351 RepID=A0A0J6SU51_9HYPH|nr:amidase [Methylobacterium aquaticum]KMO36883.1 amidase [Methylobacterium aquaticum]